MGKILADELLEKAKSLECPETGKRFSNYSELLLYIGKQLDRNQASGFVEDVSMKLENRIGPSVLTITYHLSDQYERQFLRGVEQDKDGGYTLLEISDIY